LEPTTPEVLEWYQQDSQVLVWALTSTEVLSALYRRFREGCLTARELSNCSQHVQRLREDWSEVDALELVKQRAERWLRVHSLRAADALQSGAALLATQEQPQGLDFVNDDQNLAAAAHKEGFSILSAPQASPFLFNFNSSIPIDAGFRPGSRGPFGPAKGPKTSVPSMFNSLRVQVPLTT